MRNKESERYDAIKAENTRLRARIAELEKRPNVAPEVAAFAMALESRTGVYQEVP